jgi:hypothetical protein
MKRQKYPSSQRLTRERLIEQELPAPIARQVAAVSALVAIRYTSEDSPIRDLRAILDRVINCLKKPSRYQVVRHWLTTVHRGERLRFRDELIKLKLPPPIIHKLTGFKIRGLRSRAVTLKIELPSWRWGRCAHSP